jgi:hypothetical protein
MSDGFQYGDERDAFTQSPDSDPTGGGSYLPSLPKMYQNIFDKLGMNSKRDLNQGKSLVPPKGMQDFYNSAFGAMGLNGPPVPTEMPKPPQGMQDFYNSAFKALGFPDSPQNPNRTMPARSRVPAMSPPPQSNFPARPQAIAPNPYVTDNFPARPQAMAQNPYVTDNFPARPQVIPQSQYTTEDFSDRPRPGALRSNLPHRDDFYSLNTGPYDDRPTYVGTNTKGEPASPSVSEMTPSTGRAHLTSPVIPRDAESSKGRAHISTPKEGETSDEDTGPGSLAEAKRLFPGRKLQQAVYYTEPSRGNNGGGEMHRLGVGADTSKLNPDYVSRIWEPADMSGMEKFTRGAYEKAAGGPIDAAHRISREKAVPCHVGPITMAVGGRTDHIPMRVLEGSYVLPADIVSGLGEGNTLAGSKLVSNMFSSGPFGVSAEAPQFAPLTKPSLGEYGAMQQMFNPEKKAEGGPVMSGHYRPVPIVAAGGEYVIHPDVVRKLGGGSMEKGHDYLDNFVIGVRKHLVKTLSKLPGPKRD